MTNAATRELAPLDFVGVDIAQEALEWALHGVRDTHSASNNETGFQALLEKRSKTAALV